MKVSAWLWEAGVDGGRDSGGQRAVISVGLGLGIEGSRELGRREEKAEGVGVLTTCGRGAGVVDAGRWHGGMAPAMATVAIGRRTGLGFLQKTPCFNISFCFSFKLKTTSLAI